ncbi:MAG TPA: hypothetical protein VFK10_20455, partial [Burkholderiaceae bacterium]|nr:hypothetical protein [Burkholderiaceae bacterium]
QAGKPVVVHFLGASAHAVSTPLVAATSLRHAGDLAVALARGEAARAPAVEPAATDLARIDERCAAMAPTQRAVRALFTGGTFCYEAQLAFNARGLPCKSNAPTHDSLPFDGRYDGHVFLDLGDDDYTRGRPHPMIDPSVRDALVRAQGDDAQVGAILFDVVLGYGSHDDPAGSLAAALRDAQARSRAQGCTLLAIGHVCGTDDDPQDKAAQVRALQDAGAIIVGSNIEAALLAAHGAARRAAKR